MKKQMIMLGLLLVFIQTVMATDIEIDITTDDDINSSISQGADGDIDTSLYCEAGGDCNYYLNDGDLNLPENSSGIFINQYDTYIRNGRSGSGFSLSKLIHKLGNGLYDYMTGNNKDTDAHNLLGLLDQVFISHMEHQPTLRNIDYLAEEVDRLNAEVYIMKGHLDFEPNPDYLESITGVMKSKRIGEQVITDNGLICNFEKFGYDCVELS